MILRVLLAQLSAALILTVVTGAFDFCGIRVNTSASLPIGLYRTTSDCSVRLIELCPAEPFGSLSANRAYRAKGNCPDGAEPLMKPIVAVPGDTVVVTAAGISVNGKLLPNSAPLSFDTRHRALQHWPFGKYRVEPGTVWVISSYNARSYDSRYFGPIPLSLVEHRLTALMTE